MAEEAKGDGPAPKSTREKSMLESVLGGPADDDDNPELGAVAFEGTMDARTENIRARDP